MVAVVLRFGEVELSARVVVPSEPVGSSSCDARVGASGPLTFRRWRHKEEETAVPSVHDAGSHADRTTVVLSLGNTDGTATVELAVDPDGVGIGVVMLLVGARRLVVQSRSYNSAHAVGKCSAMVWSSWLVQPSHPALPSVLRRVSRKSSYVGKDCSSE